ncbi:glycosyltransferase family 4 protein [Chryseobacterium profundimaris]|uniref:Glycosyltransferase involved in cell wall bisynthesis n=1 Tax=Chryseobacterium profundimaris TaxID=1387275 RepID=A0ABY1PEB6_9FLAO|nr:glycosyltransferase family 4 protein [Chryseobacterium profundimaris]SMP31764.1 Glycosyltransferase involved in cell wall bisynthesis [Chryseobacterium profundimaris]
MKILFICDYYDDSQLYQEPMLSKYYRHLGHKVYVITSHHKDVFNYVSEKNVKANFKETVLGRYGEIIYRLPYTINVLNKIKKFSNIFSILDEVAPDMVFLHDISFNLHEVIKYKRKNKSIKIIMDYHADYSNSGKNWVSINILHRIIRKRYLHFYLKHIDRIFPIVPHGAKFLNEIYSIENNRMEILPLGVDTLAVEEIKSNIKDYKKQILSKYNINENALLLVSGGKLDELKKTDLLIQAMGNLPSNVHLLLFGKPTTEKFKLYLEKLSEGLNVHFIGWITAEETLKLYLISDIAVFPASQSVLWQQAIGAGLPLLVGDSGGQSAEYMNKNNNIIVVDKENLNVNTFSNILTELIRDERKRKNMSEGAVLTTKTYLDYKIIAEKTLIV